MKTYQAIVSDIFGAIAGSAVILPQSMGLGIVLFSLMGYSTATGALAGIIGVAVLCIVSGLFGATIGMLSAPNGPVTMLLVAVFANLASQGISSDMMLLTLSAILIITGLSQIVFSLVGGTDLIKYIPYPVIAGQISAVGFLMIKSQIASVVSPFSQSENLYLAALPLFVAIITILSIVVTKKLSSTIPAVLVGFVVGIVFYQILNTFFIHNSFSSWVVGVVPSVDNLHFGFNLSDFHALDWHLIVVTSLALMILSSTDCLVTAIVADSQTNLKHNSKKEIIAQGIAQIIIGLLGGLGGGGTKGATLINLQSGGRRFSVFISGLLFVLLLLFFGFLGEYLPISVLAGIIMYIGFGMINFNLIHWFIYKKTRVDAFIALVVFVVTVSVNLVWAVGIGILIAMLMYFRMQIKAPIIHVTRDGVHKQSSVMRSDEELSVIKENGFFIQMFELRGNLFFATADQLLEMSEQYFRKNQILILNFLRVQFIDISGVILIFQIANRLKKSGGELILCNMHEDLGMGKKINKALEKIDKQNQLHIKIFDDTDTSFEYAENMLLKANGIICHDHTKHISLKHNTLCTKMDHKLIDLIDELSKKHKFQSEHIIFNQDEEADSIFILLKGEVEIRLYDLNGHYKRLSKYIAGTYFGEVSFVTPGKRSSSAVCVSECTLLELSHKAIIDLKHQEKEELALSLLFELGSRMGKQLRNARQEIRRLENM